MELRSVRSDEGEGREGVVGSGRQEECEDLSRPERVGRDERMEGIFKKVLNSPPTLPAQPAARIRKH